jgi:hypothetical protein
MPKLTRNRVLIAISIPHLHRHQHTHPEGKRRLTALPIGHHPISGGKPGHSDPCNSCDHYLCDRAVPHLCAERLHTSPPLSVGHGWSQWPLRRIIFFHHLFHRNAFQPDPCAFSLDIDWPAYGDRCDTSPQIAAHRKQMTDMFVGGMLIAGLFTFLPGRLMWSLFFALA